MAPHPFQPPFSFPSTSTARPSPAPTARPATSRAAIRISWSSTRPSTACWFRSPWRNHQSGAVNELQLSSSNIENLSGAAANITLEAGDTGFLNPVTFIRDSGSLTFNSAVGSPPSSLSFFADAGNGQGAPGTPGTLLEQVFGTPMTDPDSFAGTNFAAFLANSPFSMTEEASLRLIAGGSITGFNQSMTSGVPEPSTWAMLGVGFAVMAFVGFKRRKGERLATI